MVESKATGKGGKRSATSKAKGKKSGGKASVAAESKKSAASKKSTKTSKAPSRRSARNQIVEQEEENDEQKVSVLTHKFQIFSAILFKLQKFDKNFKINLNFSGFLVFLIFSTGI